MRPSIMDFLRGPGPRMAATALALSATAPAGAFGANDCRFDGTKRCGPDSGGAVYAAQARINTSGIGNSSRKMAEDNKGKGLPQRPVGPITAQGAGGPGPKAASAGSSEKKSGSFWGGVKDFVGNSNNQLAFGAGMGMGALIGIGAAVALANPLAGLAVGLVAGLALGGLLWWLNK